MKCGSDRESETKVEKRRKTEIDKQRETTAIRNWADVLRGRFLNPDKCTSVTNFVSLVMNLSVCGFLTSK